jgi:hypothetical protein
MPTLTSRPATLNFTFGTDPEVFLVDNDGVVVPADNALPPQDEALVSKACAGAPQLTPNAAYRDGMQAEMQINPSPCRAWVIDNITHAGRELVKAARAKGLRVLCAPSVPITVESLRRAIDPNSVLFGCSPELFARFDGLPHQIDIDASVHLTRYAGCHLHIGVPDPARHATWTGYNPMEAFERIRDPLGRIRAVKMMDLVVGNTLILLEREPDRVRREVYGKAGTYRETPYGYEYRTPSNLIVMHPSLMNLALGLARVANSIVGLQLEDHFKVPEDDVIAAIDGGDKALAYRNFKAIIENLAQLGKARDDLDMNCLAALEWTMRVGVEEVVPTDFESNWHLNDTAPVFHGSHGPTWWHYTSREFPNKFGNDWQQFRESYQVTENYL